METTAVGRWVLCCVGLSVGLGAQAQTPTMDDLFIEALVSSGVNVTYALDAAQLADVEALIAEVNDEAGYAPEARLTASPFVILYYIEAWNVRAPADKCTGANGCVATGGTAGLIGDGHLQWVSFLVQANKPGVPNFEIINLHTLTDSEALAQYYASQGLGHHITVVDAITARTLTDTTPDGSDRSMRLRIDGDAKVRLDVSDMPLIFPTGANALAPGVDFLVRPLPGDVAWGNEVSVHQFNICHSPPNAAASALGPCDAVALDALQFDDVIQVDIPLPAAGLNVNDFFPANGGPVRIRTESRYWRFWTQPY